MLTRLTGAGVLQRVVNGSRSFKLADPAVEILRNRITYKKPRSIDDHWQMVRAYLDSHDVIGRDDAVALLGVTPCAPR